MPLGDALPQPSVGRDQPHAQLRRDRRTSRRSSRRRSSSNRWPDRASRSAIACWSRMPELLTIAIAQDDAASASA